VRLTFVSGIWQPRCAGWNLEELESVRRTRIFVLCF
jgi:hypothetical protein